MNRRCAARFRSCFCASDAQVVAVSSDCQMAAEKVPPIASDVEEHGNASVGLRTRRSHELDPIGRHPQVGVIEVVNAEEETHPAGGLLPDNSSLVLSVGSCQQQAGGGTRRPDHDPPLGTSIVGQRGEVLNKLKTQRADEKVDGWVILLDHDGDEAEIHRATLSGLPRLGGRQVFEHHGVVAEHGGPGPVRVTLDHRLVDRLMKTQLRRGRTWAQP
jgi:hypothetical protein